MIRAGRPALVFFAFLLSAQDFTEIKFDHLVKGLGYTEGPAWSREGYLIFSDTPADRLMKWTPGSAIEVFRPASGPSGNAFDAEGRLLTCETRARRVVRLDKKGAVEVLAERWEGKRLNAPNDIVVSKTGHIYFTDPAFGAQADHRELDFYGVYHIAAKGQLKLIAKPKGRPNGIAFSPNGRILYVANSDDHTVMAYDVDHNGEATNERVAISGIEGVPDGIRIDEKGNLYVAAKGIAIYHPDGKLLTTIPTPETPANCAFGDGDFQTLYITARTSVYRVRLEVKGSVQY